MSDPMPPDLENLYTREGCILEISIYQHGGAEVHPLLVQTLLSHILISTRLHRFLHSVDITQGSSPSGGEEIFHKLSGCGWVTYMWTRKRVSGKSKRQEAPYGMQLS